MNNPKDNTDNDKIQIYHRVNRLKLKAGIPLDKSKHGYIDPDAITSAQKKIDVKEEDVHDYMGDIIEQINECWNQLLAEKEEKSRKQNIERLHNLANNIKDISDTFDYSLMNSFGLSLRNFCEFIDVDKEPHRVIAKAHLDVISIAFSQRLKGDESKQAEELKSILKQAIKKYS